MARKEAATQQRRPSRSLEQEAYLSLLRTADALAHATEEALKPFGLSGTQYNILRILRGAGTDGLCCREAAERMLTHDPDVTRLLDRLERRGLVVRTRASSDRRVITAQITPEGLRILAKLDKPIEEFHLRQLGHLGPRRLERLIGLLNSARRAGPAAA
jgi:DNA-binding MarR family transcriptional regulator